MRRSLCLVGAALALSGCLGQPGAGRRAERGYSLSSSVRAALELYRAREGHYPDSLGALVPRDLTAPDLEAIQEEFARIAPSPRMEDYPRERLTYRRDGAEYNLYFTVDGPAAAQDSCSYSSRSRVWRCTRYFT